jgi:hypothetical protein
MECEDLLNQLCEELSEDINSEVCESLKRHLASCDDCRTQMTSMRTAIHLYQCLKDSEVPPNIHERLLQVLNIKDDSPH